MHQIRVNSGSHLVAVLRTLRMRAAPPGTKRGRLVAPLVRPIKAILRVRPDPLRSLYETRLRLSTRFLRGEGLEIGALQNPLPLPTATGVRYVDRASLEQLRNEYPELADQPITRPDVVDDGERLTSIETESVDFVVANHFIEHCQNPIGTLQQHLRVLKPGGVLFMAVPDKRFTFDVDRPLTPLAHLMRDFGEGPEWSLRSHAEEWVELVERGTEERVDALVAGARSIHFHVWTPSTFHELLVYCHDDLAFPFDVELVEPNGIEFIVILRKASRGRESVGE